ncbi:MAG TPA: DUF4382 domain-containing protein [Gemmatimonadales bacterium]
MRKFPFLAFIAAVGVAAPACSDDTNAPGTGRMQAIVRDDPGTTTAAPPEAAAHGAPSSPAAFAGDINGNVQVAISVDGATWVDLGSLNGITIDLQSTGDSTNVHGEVSVPAGTYTRVRLTFQGAQARLQAGSSFGGITLNAQVNVTMGGTDQSLVVTKTVPAFVVEADAQMVTTAYLELNAEQWLTEDSVQAQVVEDAAVQTSMAARTAVRQK